MTIRANQQLHRILSDARRKIGTTQSALAKEVDCKQSAISMMERGKEDALSWAKIEAIAKVLKINVEAFAPKAPSAGVSHIDLIGKAGKYCPVFDCPANMPYVVNGKLYAMPRSESNPTDKHCPYCGELLENSCPNCGADITAKSACCRDCGTEYIATPDEVSDGIAKWADKQRQNLKNIGIA